jgi:hypothetical protein
MPIDYFKEYPILKETWDLITDQRERVLPELRKESHRVYS